MSHGALSIKCPVLRCGREPGRRCLQVGSQGGMDRDIPHRERVIASGGGADRWEKLLDTHQFWRCNHSSIGPEDHCRCGYRPRDWREWAVHVAELIEALPR
ncbi:zinc finger domain-containing protein [Mycobacteroides abscessus]|uniref:zinc finger domain-containing protein n=1 Tax=Mycobacteroides abscessus TaxID=36809 RepID=UPI004025CD31